MKISTTSQRIATLFDQRVKSDKNIHNAHLLVHSDGNHLHLNLAGGNAKNTAGNFIQMGQPVFMASVGKLFTAILIGMLCEQGKLSFDFRICDLLEPDLLNGLHVFSGINYSDQIRLKHLLNHTSGLPDYFEDKPARGPGMVERILTEPERIYQPREIINWSKENLKSRFPPGKGFHYSDTGYHLLGLVIEAVTGMPFHIALCLSLIHI